MMNNIFSIRKILRNNKGSTAIEFAFVLPSLAIFCLVGFDILSYYYYRGLVVSDTQYYTRKAELGDQDLNVIVQDLKNDVAKKLNISPETVIVSTKINSNFGAARGEFITQDRPPLGNNSAGNDCFFDVNHNKKFDSSLPENAKSPNEILTMNVFTKYRTSFISIFGIDKIENINVRSFARFQPYQNMKNDITRDYGSEFCP